MCNIFMLSTKASNPPQSSHQVQIMLHIFHYGGHYSNSDCKATLLFLPQAHVNQPFLVFISYPKNAVE